MQSSDQERCPVLSELSAAPTSTTRRGRQHGAGSRAREGSSARQRHPGTDSAASSRQPGHLVRPEGNTGDHASCSPTRPGPRPDGATRGGSGHAAPPRRAGAGGGGTAARSPHSVGSAARPPRAPLSRGRALTPSPRPRLPRGAGPLRAIGRRSASPGPSAARAERPLPLPARRRRRTLVPPGGRAAPRARCHGRAESGGRGRPGRRGRLRAESGAEAVSQLRGCRATRPRSSPRPLRRFAGRRGLPCGPSVQRAFPAGSGAALLGALPALPVPSSCAVPAAPCQQQRSRRGCAR